MFCNQCGKSLPDGSKFCTGCGASLSSAPTETPANPTAPAIPNTPPTPAAPSVPPTPPPAVGQPAPPQPTGEPSKKGKKEKQPKAPKQPKKKGKGALGLIIALVLLLVTCGGAYWFSFPLKVTIDQTGDLTTKTGTVEALTLTANTNQMITGMSYALNPDEVLVDGTPAPEEAWVYLPLTLTGNNPFAKTAALPDLTIPAGESLLVVKVDTLFGSYTKTYTLEFEIGYIAAPNPDAIISTDEGLELISDELLVVAAADADTDELEDLFAALDGEIVGEIYIQDTYQVRFAGMGEYYLEDIKATLEASDLVELVSYNIMLDAEISVVPNDSAFDDWDVENPAGNNWWLELIDAPAAWEYTDQMTPIAVGLMDSTLDYDHEDLLVNERRLYIEPSDDFSSVQDLEEYCTTLLPTLDPADEDDLEEIGTINHGTHCAGIISAIYNNGKGVSGTSSNASLFFQTFWDTSIASDNTLNLYSSGATAMYNFTELVISGCRVISISIGSSEPSEPGSIYETSLATHFNRVTTKLENAGCDFLIVKSAGNSNEPADRYLMNRLFTTGANIRAHTIIVGAVENSSSWVNQLAHTLGSEKIYNVADYSNFGSIVDIMAPGSDVYNTYYDSYGYMSGTSMATPVVAGVATMVYGMNEGLTYQQVKSFILNSTEKQTAKQGYTYGIVNAGKAVSIAASLTDIPLEYEKPVMGFLTGDIQDVKSGESITNVSVTLIDDEGTTYTGGANGEGTYDYPLPPGLYTMKVEAEGYMDLTVFNLEIVENLCTYNIRLNMVEDEAADGTISGRVIDAFDGENIPWAAILLYPGVNNTEGTPAAESFSDETGNYTATLAPGNYTMVVTAEGYTQGTANVVVVSDTERGEQDCSLSPILNDGEVRIVLTWGQNPYDVDSHLFGPTPTGGEYHISFRDMNYDYDGTAYAKLDIDDRRSYGPETTSIYHSSSGTYTFGVHDYSNGSRSDCDELAYSDATVTVYLAGHSAPIVYHVPNLPGTYWEVFSLTDGVITPINTMSYDSRP